MDAFGNWFLICIVLLTIILLGEDKPKGNGKANSNIA